MRKTLLFVVFALLIFSLSSCVVFQKVMDVSGSWVVAMDGNLDASSLRSLAGEENTPREPYLYSTLKLTQTGNQLSGKYYIMFYEANVSGTIGEDDSFEIEFALPLMDAQRDNGERDAYTYVLSGKASGSKTMFNKKATKIIGKFYPKASPNDSREFEATQ